MVIGLPGTGSAHLVLSPPVGWGLFLFLTFLGLLGAGALSAGFTWISR